MQRSLMYLFVFALMALWLPACATIAKENEKEGEEKGEVKVKIDQVPAAVRATIEEEAKGAKIDTVDKETDDGKTIYEADAMIKGKNYEIKVMEDGTLLSKKLDQEDEKGGKEDKEKGEKDEKEEKK